MAISIYPVRVGGVMCVTVVLLILTSCVGEPSVGSTAQAIIGGENDVSSDPTSQARRDAVVLLNFNCTGTLVTPRLVLTAKHCVGRSGTNEVYFGADARSAPAFSLTDIGCVAVVGVCGEEADALDVAVLVLPERIELRGATGNFPAVPADVVLGDPLVGGVPNPDAWVGEPITAVGWGTTDVDEINVPDVRQARAGMVDDVTGEVLVFAPAPTTLPGDSGGPSYLGDPNTGAIRVLGVDRNRDADVRTTTPIVAAWLQPLLTGFVGDIYVGPRDLPVAEAGDRLPEHDLLDPDGDGLLDENDNCPDVDNRRQVDSDFDGLGDACDTCPDTFDRTFSDPDGDGFNNDSCDTCPEFNEDLSDSDGDGILDACDVCLDIPDLPGAPNCNLDAELTEGVDPIPDACDPIPCPEGNLVNEVLPSDIPALPTFIENSGIETFGVNQRSGPRLVYRSGHRFCECSVATGDTEDARQDCVEQAGCIIDSDAYGLAPALWTDLSLGERTSDAPCRDGRTEEDRECEVSYGRARELQTPITLSWDFLNDADRFEWEVTPLGPDAASIRGVLWTHAFEGVETCIGFTCNPLVLTNTERRLSSHYWSGEVAREPARRSPAEPTEPLLPIWFPIPDCPYCSGAARLGWLVSPACLQTGLCGLELADVRFPEFDLEASRVTNAAVFATPSVDYVVAADWRFPNLSTRPLIVVLADDGTELVGALANIDGQLIDVAEQIPDLPPFLQAASTALDIGPAARTQHGVVYRARDAALFVFGGVRDDGSPAGDLWRLDVLRRRWSPIPLALPHSRTVGRVLAAAFHPTEGVIYAFARTERAEDPGDELKRRRSRHRARPRTALLRIEPNGATEVLHEWQSHPRWAEHGMVFDDQGRLLVTSMGRRHALMVRTDVRRLHAIDGIAIIRGQVRTQPVYDGTGYSFLTQDDDQLRASGVADADFFRPRRFRFESCL